MNGEDIKDIVVALINNDYFDRYTKDVPENLGKDIAKFVKVYYEEVNK